MRLGGRAWGAPSPQGSGWPVPLSPRPPASNKPSCHFSLGSLPYLIGA